MSKSNAMMYHTFTNLSLLLKKLTNTLKFCQKVVIFLQWFQMPKISQQLFTTFWQNLSIRDNFFKRKHLK